ncbi:L-fuculokinase [bioreactor metagenome]|uniref:L-fuculokinase n=1 Tax=bioreactor metagenome TaxID=1076179 RepID=A0A645G786_9ZZZZ
MDQVGFDRFVSIVGGQPAVAFLPNKILWFKKNEPELFAKTACFLQASSFINYKLTGKMTMDIDQASRTQCLDINTMEWSDEIGDVIGVVSRSRELGGNREIQSRTLLTERQQAVTRMARMALGAHADAVVGMRFDTCQVSAEVIEVVAYGTAVRLAEAPGFSAPGIDLPRPSTGASATHPPTPPTV